MTRPKQLIKSQYETLAAFRYTLRQFIRFSEQAAQAASITAQQHQALLAIKGFPGRDSVTVGELAERLQLRHHSTVGLIDRLVTEKLVMRAPSTEDRREVFVRLTSRGENVLEKLTSAHEEELKRLGPGLGLLLKRLACVDEDRSVFFTSMPVARKNDKKMKQVRRNPCASRRHRYTVNEDDIN